MLSGFRNEQLLLAFIPIACQRCFFLSCSQAAAQGVAEWRQGRGV